MSKYNFKKFGFSEKELESHIDLFISVSDLYYMKNSSIRIIV